LPAARAALRTRLGDVGFPRCSDDTSGERLILAFDELASNGLRHGESPVVATVVAGSGGWLLSVSDRAPESVPAPAVDRDPAQGWHRAAVASGRTTVAGHDEGDRTPPVAGHLDREVDAVEGGEHAFDVAREVLAGRVELVQLGVRGSGGVEQRREHVDDLVQG